jgi:fumarylacetoacetate (FAA) hydrolase
MKLATLKEGGRDGTLIVVSRDMTRAVEAKDIAASLQAALDDWDQTAPRLNTLYDELNADQVEDAFDLDMNDLAAPCPAATSSSTARPTCRMSSACARPAAPRCRRASSPTR